MNEIRKDTVTECMRKTNSLIKESTKSRQEKITTLEKNRIHTSPTKI